MNLTRRSVLAGTAGAITTGALAGCLDDVASDAEGSAGSGYAAFFTLWDWSEQVAGDELSFENPVPAGTMGHGFEPSSEVLTEIADSDVFVYLDTSEFSWAQEAADRLEADYPDVVVVDGLDGIDLLEWDHDHDDDHGDDHHDDDHGDDHHDDDHGDDHHDDDHGDDHHDDDHDDHDHDHGEYDPHVWVDPVRAQRIVDNIADGLADADPDNEETFRDNAEAYNDRLEDLHGEFEDLFANADRDVIVVAGHDSYQYLEDRYGFEVHTPVGVSPHDEPSQDDIAETIDLVDEHGIDTILYDHFESPTLAETIVENSDATETLAITPAEGTTDEWAEEGWGYLEQMEEINLSAFEQAVGSQ
ncbi:metal ABC transporter substrate-binding protein [Natrononativus amylolyticus]|uniref:metal ABC transporter substrate-binding protein n=1 Tax=Natrononativus amylolyticus TaxID=2963434 RepID=UPI0020CC126B|nr:zinc ABC transporter substrate-binding protein [Natrononativus amylolyticus]